MIAGRVVRFDGVRGYGFIAPEHGGEDVFLHVNDLLIPESSVHAGTMVKFEVEEGDRGPKASSVQLAERTQPAMMPPPPALRRQPPPSGQAPDAGDQGGEEPTCDVLSAGEYTSEVTELLLSHASWLTGAQISQLRRQLVELGERHGWVEG